MTDINKRIEQYVALRDMIKNLKERHARELQAPTELMHKVGGFIQDFMRDNGITDSLKTAAGTCYLKTRYTATVADGEAFMEFIKAGHWDLIQHRASPEAVRDYVKEHNTLPAGVTLSAIQDVGVRRPGKSKE